MTFKGSIVIGDPCYFVKEEDWELCEFGDRMDKIGFSDYMTIRFPDDPQVVIDEKTGDLFGGICQDSGYIVVVYLDELKEYNADYEKALNIIIDSKTQYPSACNSVETLLINKNFQRKEELLSALQNAGIKLVYNPDNWHVEYSDTIMSVKEVNSIDEAVNHINEYSSGHTEAIITEDRENASYFMNKVDSAGVYHNTSTRFADGFRYGFGAEVGISTNKTHARGPVGLEGLTIYKYTLQGNGDIVKDYAEGKKKFNHKDLT